MSLLSIVHLDKTVAKRISFNSASVEEANGATLTSMSFDNGIATFAAASSKMKYENIKANTTDGISYHLTNLVDMDWNGANTDNVISHFIDTDQYVSIYKGGGNLVFLIQSSSGNWRMITYNAGHIRNHKDLIITIAATLIVKVYADGTELTQTGNTDNGSPVDLEVSSLYIGATVSGTARFVAQLDCLDIYNRTLTAEEVSALYKNQLYTPPSPNNSLVLNIPVNGSIYDTQGNTITNTDVKVVRDGSKDVMEFNGSTSYLNLDSCVASLNDNSYGTISLWIKPKEETNQRTMLCFGDTDDQQFFYINANANETIDAGLTLNGYGHWNVRTTNQVLFENKWVHICITQDRIQPKIYINGILVAQTNTTSTHLSSWFAQQTVPGIDNGRLGCFNAAGFGNANFYGKAYKDLKVLSRAYTAEEVARDYNSSKRLYGL